MIQLQDYSALVPLQPIEIDYAVYDLQTKFKTNIDWLSHSYGKAYRVEKDKNGDRLYLPQIYISNTDGKYSLTPVTPDNDKKGILFFVVEKERPVNYESNTENQLTYNVGLVFWTNLELIDAVLVANEDFTQTLIKEARGLLTNGLLGAGYRVVINEITRDLKEVFKEFTLNEYRYNQIPYSAFRINITITLREECYTAPDRETALLQNISKSEILEVLLPTLDFSGTDFNALTPQQITDLTNRLTV